MQRKFARKWAEYVLRLEECVYSKLGQTEHFRSLADGASRADTMTAHGTFNVYLNNHHPPSKKPSPIPSFAPCLTESLNSAESLEGVAVFSKEYSSGGTGGGAD